MNPSTPRKRVVITGIGAVTPCGLGIQDCWANLLAGKSGIRRVTQINPDDFSCKVGGEVVGFVVEDFMDRKESRRNDRYTHLAMGAAKLALEDAQLDLARVNKDRFGVIIGSGIGGIHTYEEQALRLFVEKSKKASAFMIPSMISNMAGGIIAIEIGARGPNFAVVSACSTGSHALGESFKMLRDNEADLVLAGGAEAAISILGYAGFCAMKAMCTNFNDQPSRASRPFDQKRAGFVMGEGAGLLLLETLDHAEQRGAHIYCELAGYATTCDAFHPTAPETEGRGLAIALDLALERSGILPSQVDYLNAHGTSTYYNDKVETTAIKKVFGSHASKLHISSTKSMTGHLLGAAGGIEAAVCAKVIQEGWIPPTINYEYPDPECDLDYTPNAKREASVKVAVSTNLGFGGHNTALVLKAI